jgi:methionyl-tRNA formyltransferase
MEFRLFDSSIAPGAPEDPPGTVISTSAGGVQIAVIGGILTVARIRVDGGAKVSADEVLSPGDHLVRGTIDES